MPRPSSPSAIAAAVRAIGGDSDLSVVLPALGDWLLARVIALAPDVHHLVRAIAALCGRLPDVLDPPTVADPAFFDALVRLIGTAEGQNALRAWAEVVPAGWGAAHAGALIIEARLDTCDASAAAALIGPDDRSASLLRSSADIAFAIRRWGQADPAAPTAWATALSPAERDRLITALRRNPFAYASCLPWLPPDTAGQTPIDDDALGEALDAFVAASPTARAQRAADMRRLVTDAHPAYLSALTRLAYATGSDDVWRRIRTLIQGSPDDAWRVVAAAPWDALPDDVRRVILRRADTSDVCAAVAAARGKRTSGSIFWKTAPAFFAALDPRVWDALDAATQQRWRRALFDGAAHLAVRALGLRPEVLARATLNGGLVRAARRHARNEAAVRAALLPVALRALSLDQTDALIAAMPTPPPDPGAVVRIASGHGDPDNGAPVRATAIRSVDLALAVTLQRCARGDERARPACAALQDALRGRTWDDLAPIMPLLTDDARAALMFEADALIVRLAHPAHRDALRRALDRLASLPPAEGAPAHLAIHRWIADDRPAHRSEGATALAHVLRAHGAMFLALADALTDDLRAAVLPLPEDAALADALRALVRDNPVGGRTLACALHDRDWRQALRALLMAEPHHAAAIWQALDDATRRAIVAAITAAPSDADPLAVHDSIAALALAALRHGDADLRTAGGAALTARSARIRAIWDDLPLAVRHDLGALPAFADLPVVHARPVIQRGFRCGRA